MRKLVIFLSVWLGLVAGSFAAETFTLTDGTSLSGDIVSSDAIGVMIHTTTDAYSTYQWTNFSQASLRQLVNNPKYHALAGPLVEPTAADLPAPPEITVHEVTRMTLPTNPSIIGGLTHSSVGLFILFVLYVANLYAAYEIAVVRELGRPLAVVVAAALPVVGPIIFLMQPGRQPVAEIMPEEGLPGEPSPAGGPAAAPPATGASASTSSSSARPPAHSGAGQRAEPSPDDIQIVSASWQPAQEEKKKPQPQVYARGKFTLNKRFIETRFANYIGEVKSEARNFTMQIKTLKETIEVECIKQVGTTEAIFETAQGPVTATFGDIQEIRLTPKPS